MSLNEQMTGLREVLADIIAGSIESSDERAKFKKDVSDDDLRRHYIEVTGERVKHPGTRSSAVVEHVDVFFNKIFPKLQKYFRETRKSMAKEIMIICAYGYAASIQYDTSYA
jgi:hypothetical protein